MAKKTAAKKTASKKKRTAAQKRATAKMIAANKKRASKKKASARKKRTTRTTPRRRPTTRLRGAGGARRTNPVSDSLYGIFTNVRRGNGWSPVYLFSLTMQSGDVTAKWTPNVTFAMVGKSQAMQDIGTILEQKGLIPEDSGGAAWVEKYNTMRRK